MKRHSRRRASAAFALLAVLVTTSSAHADPGADGARLRLPVPEAQRPLTLPSLVLSPQVGFQVDRRPPGVTFGDLDVSGSFGITDDVTVHALVAPLQLWSPTGGGGPQYGETNRNAGPAAGVKLRVVRGPVEIAGNLTASVITIPGLSGAQVTPAIPVRIHATDMLRLDVAPAMTFQWASTTGPGGTPANAVRVAVPVTLLGNLTQSFDLGVTSGLTIYDTHDVRATTGIPAGILLGFAVAGPNGPVLDVDPFFDFPYLVMPGRSSVTNTNQYQVGVNLVGYLYL